MIKTRLQNTPSNINIPPKKLSYALALEHSSTLIKILMPLCIIVLCGLSIVVLPVSGIVLSGLHEGKALDELVNKELLSSVHVIGALLGWVGSLLLFIVCYQYIKKRNFREQKNYYRLGKVRELSDEQATALQLAAIQAYEVGEWVETLEFFPCEIRIADNAKQFKFFQFLSKNEARQTLDKWWGIVSTKQYKDMVDQLYAGLHSCLFAEQMQSEERTHMVERLAGLIQKPESYVEQCFEQRANKPKQLVWGFDLYRIIAISRSAYVCGYISEDEAWQEILKAAALIHYLFDNLEDFYDNYRLGNAFWSNDFDLAKEKLEGWVDFRDNCSWPSKKLAWPKVSNIELPTVIKANGEKEQTDDDNQFGFV